MTIKSRYMPESCCSIVKPRGFLGRSHYNFQRSNSVPKLFLLRKVPNQARKRLSTVRTPGAAIQKARDWSGTEKPKMSPDGDRLADIMRDREIDQRLMAREAKSVT